ncbi:hypothetical protein P775_18180 [Puniceibacterium antarcticum]|uniref:Excalibur calcium-binding domain-containing protein n=1 Tax=Puniceibacterium antarcticum TaxID=1206336 RepID=A0A2G8RAE3_9RHOB|nr:hypothetical protein [Puniceibacterium antarcticum]PIL18502.1 hypothetical protein P775_18180 [Puniceibacterium antarcticum]
MKQFLLCGVAALTLAGCAGSGTDISDRQARREAELLGNAQDSGQGGFVPAPAGVMSSNLDNGDPAIAAAESALGGSTFSSAGSNLEPQVATNAAGISQENNFDAVSGERDIAADAAMIARNRAQYQVIQPTALPSRAGASGPNIVAYALNTSNSIGTPLYTRSVFKSETKAARACAGYASPDLAQEAFLAAGGPERDRYSLDPDGDGYACAWDPSPYRAVRRN